MNCQSCYAETSNGLALCDLCQRKARAIFDVLPIYFRNLARWRPGRAGTRPTPGSRMPKGLTTAADDRVSRAIDEAGNALSTWARKLADDRVVEPPTGDDEAEQAEALCAWFADQLTSIATLDWCGEFICNERHEKGADCDGLGHHEYRLRNLTMTAAPGWYAGACARRVTMEATCGAPTYVVPGLTWVTCGACGATTYARDHLDTILDEARGWVARPMRLAEAAVALLDTELSVPRLHKRISKWGERGQLDVVRDHDYAPKRYRFGEVLDRLFAEGATRLDETGAKAS